MKTRNSPWLLVVLMFIMASCTNRECKMLTKVNEDGTCERTIGLKLDSAQLLSGKIDTIKNVLRADKGWQWSWSLKGDTIRHALPMSRHTYDSIKALTSQNASDTIVVNASAKWPSAEEMAGNTVFNLDSSRILKPHATLKRSFRWFYTYYTYQETYTQQAVHFKYPLTKFMTKDEMGYWLTGTPNLAKGLNGVETDDIVSRIKNKHSDWLTANYFECIFQLIIDHYDQIKPAPVNKAHFIQLHDSLYHKCLKEQEQIFDGKNLTKLFNAFFHSDAYTKILTNEQLMDKAKQPLTDYITLTQFAVDYTLVMPGTIIDAGFGNIGADSTHANKGMATYRLSGERLFAGDCIITARSRKTSIWAFVVTGMGIVALFILPLHKGKKLRRH